MLTKDLLEENEAQNLSGFLVLKGILYCKYKLQLTETVCDDSLIMSYFRIRLRGGNVIWG